MAAGQTALHLACELRRLEAVSALVEGGANVEIEDHARRTPVMVAARAGFLEPIRLMVTKTRVDLYHKDKDNKMAVQLVPLHSPFTRLALETMCGWELLAAARKGKLQKVSTPRYRWSCKFPLRCLILTQVVPRAGDNTPGEWC
eukprot:3888766-Rhodomonas_salina.6